MQLVRVDMRKWPDQLHWQYEAVQLGEDVHGSWLHVPWNTVARRGTEPARQLGIGFIELVPRDAWWMAEFYVSHPEHSVYVNIGTPPVWEGDRVSQTDLDLDVVLTVDGQVRVLDEDEFAEHRVYLRYPPDLVAAAQGAADRAADLLRRRHPPFDGAANPWLRMVDPASLG